MRGGQAVVEKQSRLSENCDEVKDTPPCFDYVLMQLERYARTKLLGPYILATPPFEGAHLLHTAR